MGKNKNKKYKPIENQTNLPKPQVEPQNNRFPFQFTPKQILILWLSKLLPPGDKFKLKLIPQNNTFLLQGSKTQYQKFIKELKDYLNGQQIKKIKLKCMNSQIIQRIQFQLKGQYKFQIFKSTIIGYVCEYINQKYQYSHLQSIKDTLFAQNSNFFIIILNKQDTDIVLQKIDEIIEEYTDSLSQSMVKKNNGTNSTSKIQNPSKIVKKQSRCQDQPIKKNKYIRKQQNQQEQEIQKQKNTKKKNKFVQKKKQSSQDQYQQIEQGVTFYDLSQNNHQKKIQDKGQSSKYKEKQTQRQKIRGNRVFTKKLVFSQTFDLRILNLEHFKNWVRRNKQINLNDIEFAREDDTNLTITLFDDRNNSSSKLSAIQMYVKFQKLLPIKNIKNEDVQKFIKDNDGKQYINLEYVKGYMAPNLDLKNLRHCIRNNTINKNYKNTQEFQVLQIIGLMTQIDKVSQRFYKFIDSLPKQDKIIPFYLEKPDLEKYIRQDDRIRKLIVDSINEEIKQFPEIKSHKIQFIVSQVQLEVIVKYQHFQKFQTIIKPQLSKILKDKIKFHQFSQISHENYQKFKQKYLLVKDKQKIGLISSDKHFAKTISQFTNELNKQKIPVEQCREIDKAKAAGIQQIYQKSIVNKEYESLKMNKSQQVNNAYIFHIYGYQYQVQKFLKKIDSCLSQIDKNTIQESYQLLEQQVNILNNNKNLETEIKKNYKVTMIIRKGISIGASIKINENINISIMKGWENKLDKLKTGTIFIFRSKEQAQSIKNHFLNNLKFMLKNHNNNEIIKKKEEDRNYIFIYANQATPEKIISLALQQKQTDEIIIGIMMPQKNKKVFLKNLIKQCLLLKASVRITIIQTKIDQDLQKSIGIQSSTNQNKKIKKWYVDGRQGKIFYLEKGNEKINYAFENGLKKVVLENQELQIKDITHILQISTQKITHRQSGVQISINFLPNKITFLLNNTEFEFPSSLYKQVKEAASKKIDNLPISLGLYEINFTNNTQINLFSNYQRKIAFIQEQIKNQFNAKILVNYNIKINQVTLSHNNLQSKMIKKAWQCIIEHLKTHSFTSELNIDFSQIQQFQKNEILDLARQFGIKITIDQKLNKILTQGYKKNDIARFSKIIEMMQKKKKIADISYPEYWEQQKEDIQLFNVKKNSKQFQKIQKQFSIGEIKELKRVQNKIIFKKYYDQKNFLSYINDGNLVKQQMLYHGTSKTDPEVIYSDKEQAFNINYSSDNNLLGKGIYFAERSQYSNKYCYQSTLNLRKQMFYCLVLVGESEKIDYSRIQVDHAKTKNIKDTNFKNNQKKLKYESNTSFYGNSNIFVVYKSRRAYPLYLITY